MSKVRIRGLKSFSALASAVAVALLLPLACGGHAHRESDGSPAVQAGGSGGSLAPRAGGGSGASEPGPPDTSGAGPGGTLGLGDAGAAGAFGSGEAGEAGESGAGGAPSCDARPCANGYLCVDGACTTSCASNADCRDDAFCGEQRCHLDAVSLTAGYQASCVVLVDQSVHCWGMDGLSQLDLEPGSVFPTPVAVNWGKVSGVSMGYFFSCVLLPGGGVACRGTNAMGQLGKGEQDSTPPGVAGLGPSGERAVQLSAGYNHACVVLESGGVKCWGGWPNGTGQPYASSSVPVAVTGLGGKASQVSVGSAYNCALLEDQSVHCWGENYDCALGVPDSLEISATPVAVQGLPGASNPVVSIAAGQRHVCALLSSGAVACWGNDNFGQLGDGAATYDDSCAPKLVPGLPIAGNATVSVSSGGDGSCAVLADGSALCWGDNLSGLLGTSTHSENARPALVQSLPDGIRSLSLGTSHSCALSSDGSARCWGNNDQGQLGALTPGVHDSSSPVRVIGW